LASFYILLISTSEHWAFTKEHHLSVGTCGFVYAHKNILWHVDPLLGNDRETTAHKQQQWNGVFYVVQAKML
jgi:hypothetical protein